MATKKAAKKAVKKTTRNAAAKRAVSTFQVDLRLLIDLRDNDLKPLAETPRALSAQEAGALAGKAFNTVASFLKKCGGPGGGESPTKIRVVNGN